MIAATGWTYDYVENCMTLPRTMELMDQWGKRPPASFYFSARLGVTEKSKKEQDLSTLSDFPGMNRG